MPSVKLDNLTFVHIPRSAGTSIGHWLINNRGNSSVKSWYNHPKLSDMNPSGVSFTVIRNPWDRIVSLYYYTKKVKVTHGDIIPFGISDNQAQQHINQINNIKEWPDFNKWILNLESFKMPEIFWFNMLTPQSSWADNVDIILKYENLEQDFVKIQDLFGCHVNLPQENSTNRELYKYLYTSKSKDLIYKWFKDDIQHWEYEF